jgi:hypothetical protein
MPQSCHSPLTATGRNLSPVAACWKLDREVALSAYSVEKLHFRAEAIFRFYGNAAENPRKTRRTVD